MIWRSNGNDDVPAPVIRGATRKRENKRKENQKKKKRKTNNFLTILRLVLIGLADCSFRRERARTLALHVLSHFCMKHEAPKSFSDICTSFGDICRAKRQARFAKKPNTTYAVRPDIFAKRTIFRNSQLCSAISLRLPLAAASRNAARRGTLQDTRVRNAREHQRESERERGEGGNENPRNGAKMGLLLFSLLHVHRRNRFPIQQCIQCITYRGRREHRDASASRRATGARKNRGSIRLTRRASWRIRVAERIQRNARDA